MRDKPIILINNVYSYRNRGDSAIIEAIAIWLQENIRNVEIVLLSQFWKENESYYKSKGWASAPLLWDVPMMNNKLLRILMAFFNLLKIVILLPIKRNASSNKDTLWLYENCDMIIDAGGGSFFSSNKYLFYLGLYQHIANLYFGCFFGKKIVIAPQSFGPFNKVADAQAFAFIAKKVNSVYVREKISEELLCELDVPYKRVPDCAFLNNFVRDPSTVCQSSLVKIDGSALNIGITVLDWSWAISGVNPDSCSVYLAKISQAIQKLNRTEPVTIHIFSQTDVSTERSDYHVAMELKELLDSGRIVSVLHDVENSASDLCHLYKSMDVFLGSRMHSCIFALNQNVPVVALSYQPKTIGVLRWALDELKVLPIDSFTHEDLTQALEYSISHRDALSESLKLKIPLLQEEVDRAFKEEFLQGDKGIKL